MSVIRIKPLHYCHVLNVNTNTTSVVCGPTTYTKKENETSTAPLKMVMVPSRHYVRVRNPVAVDDKGVPLVDPVTGFATLRHGCEEIRLERPPFPLYPGEALVGEVTKLRVIAEQTALRLRAKQDFGTCKAGEEWLLPGPATYVPNVEEEVVETVSSHIIKAGEALKLRAVRDLGTHKAGDTWLVREQGAYLPQIGEQVVGVVPATVLTEKLALHLRAKSNFVDVYKVARRAGSEWLVTLKNADSHIPDVHEEPMGERVITALNNRQFCVVLNPVDAKTGLLRHGERELRRGEQSFFLQPGEELVGNVESIYVLSEEQALLLSAREQFEDGAIVRKPGDRWLKRGPCEYIPNVATQVVERRNLIPLDEGEGIYVRNLTTGQINAIIGKSHLVKEEEVLWMKELPGDVEEVLRASNKSERERHRVVSYRAPYNTAVRIYDYVAAKSRIVFGPDLVMLEPNEQFTLIQLSGGTPKRENVVKSIHLEMGPSFMTDVVEVETSDHARLRLKLAYSWRFDVDRTKPESYEKMFNINDFIGIACRGIASRVRGSVAAVTFSAFHSNSTEVITAGVFGRNANGTCREALLFQENNLLISGVDVQNVEPVDQRTVEALSKSVQQAIEITTNASEDAHKHEAVRLDQLNKGKLERQKMEAQIEREAKRTELVVLKGDTETVKRIGEATSSAEALKKAAEISGTYGLEQAKLRAQAQVVQLQQQLEEMKAKNAQELAHHAELLRLERERNAQRAQIESKKFAQAMEAIGRDTLIVMARAGPEHQAKLLESLGLQGYILTDGNSPINLLTAAQSFVSEQQKPAVLQLADK